MSGGSTLSALVTRMLVRYRRCAERLHDPVTAERFGALVRHVFERFLAAARRPAHALPEPHQRIDHERRAGQAHHREPGVGIEQQKREADDRERLAHQIAHRLRDGKLNLRDIVGQPRHQPSGRLARKERRRLPQNVSEEHVAQVLDDALSNVGHQVRRQVRADTLEEVQHEDRRRDESERLARGQDFVEDRLDEICDAGRRDAVHDHRHDRAGQPAPIGPGVLEQAQESGHSPNRNFSSTQTATTPSRQPIFLPSS
jgi:hypothetical protein